MYRISLNAKLVVKNIFSFKITENNSFHNEYCLDSTSTTNFC